MIPAMLDGQNGIGEQRERNCKPQDRDHNESPHCDCFLMGRIETGRGNTRNREGRLLGFLYGQEVGKFPLSCPLVFLIGGTMCMANRKVRGRGSFKRWGPRGCL